MALLTTSLLSLGLLAGSVTAPQLSTLSNVLAVAVSEDTRLNVLSSRDVERVIAFEADRATLGCEASESCLAELAGALGANWVIFGEIGQLGSKTVLTLNLFDSDQAVSAGRIIVRASSIEELGDTISARAHELTEKISAPKDDESEQNAKRVKVVVLDLKSPDLSATSTPPAPPSTPGVQDQTASEQGSVLDLVFYGVGGLTAASGLLVAVGGLYFGAQALSEKRTASDPVNGYDVAKASARQAQSSAQIADLLFGVGAGVVVIGGAVAAFGLLVEE